MSMRKSAVALVAAFLFLLPGCASKYGEQHTNVAYYPSCYRPIDDLRRSEHTVAKSTATGAVLGAAGGALIGLLTTGKWQGAVMGAAMGGVGGSMVGNAYGSQQQQREDNMRLNRYLQELDGDISNLDVASAAARSSLQCYDREFQALLGGIRSGQISREVAHSRYVEIQNGREEAIAILGDAAAQGESLDQQYEQAFASEEQQIRSPQAMSQGQAAYQQKASALNAARKRKQAITRKTASIREEKTQAQNVTRSQNKEINDALSQLRDIRA